MKTHYLIALLLLLGLLAGCGTTDSAMRGAGKTDSYVTGFHDGRHSGMQEAGNLFEHFIRDTERYESDPDYREGWLAGEKEGRKLQYEVTIGGAIAAGAYSGHHSGNSVDQIGKDALKDVDTSELKNLEKNR